MKKKILYIHHGKGLGGAPLSLLYLIQALDKTKYEPVVLFLHHSKAFDLYKQKGLNPLGPVNRYDFSHTKIWWFRWYHPHLLLRGIRDTLITMQRTAHEWLEKIKPDIIHLNTSSLIAWGKVAKQKGISVVWHVREPLAPGYLGIRKKMITHYVKTYSDAIVPICKNDAKPWKHLAKTRVVYNTADEAVFDFAIKPDSFEKKHNLKKDDPKVLYVGGMSEEKGTLVILQVFEKLLKKVPNAKLLLAGYCEKIAQTSYLKTFFPAHKFCKKVWQLIEKLGDSVVLLGAIQNVPEAMAASRVLVFPATVGHFARPIVEAGLMKTPVIASALPPLDELVVHGKTGFLLDYKDHEQWVEKLELLLTDKDVNKNMGEEAFTFCTASFGLKKHIQRIHNVYEGVLKKRVTE